MSVLLWLLAGSAAAESYRFRHFGPDDGLNTAVGQILQDRTGFLWIGTGDGLFRYDGASFKRFGKDGGLPSASIRRLLESPDGTLWVLTGRGLARRHGVNFEAVPSIPDSQAGQWHAMAVSAQGRLYVGTSRGMASAAIPTGGSAPRFAPLEGVPGEPVAGIYAERDGTLWFGCRLDLCRMEGGKLRRYGEADGLPPEHWGAILRDHHGDLWVRGPEHLSVLRAGARRFVAGDDGLPQSSNGIVTLLEDRDGTLLVTTDRGLARRVDGRWSLVGQAQGLESEAVTTVYEDREGSLWIGLWGAGVARWTGHAKWSSWTVADGLSNNIIWAVRRHPAGALWLGTDRGLVRMEDGKPPRIWLKSDGLAGDKIKAITFGPDGAVWAASLPGGVSRLDPVTGRILTFASDKGLKDTRIIAIHIDREQGLWASTGTGLYRSTNLGPQLRFERQIPEGSQEHTMFFRMLTDRHGRIWVTSTDGLFCRDGATWKRYTKSDGLKANSVAHVAETDDGSIWVAYREPLGLSRLRFGGGRVEVEHVTKQEGLPSDYVLFLGLDSRRRLWTGTDYGAAVLADRQWVVYTHDDGLIWDDCAANSFWADTDGAVWIGTLKGLSRFQPGKEIRARAAPAAAVTAVRFGRLPSADPAGEFAQVSYRDHDFEVSYAAQTFLHEKDVRFRYRLVGLDENWITTALREARYPSLPAGTYRFEVMASNGRGWSAAPATVSFRIIPPWWQRWWFRLLAAGALAAMVALLLRARGRSTAQEHSRLEAAVRQRTSELELQKQVVEQQKAVIEELLERSQEASRLKSEFLANMSHEIRTPMNGVLGMTQLVLGTKLDEEQRDYMSTIRESGDALLSVINDILDFSKIEAGKMDLAHEAFRIRKCVDDALQVFAWKAQEKGIQLTSRIDPKAPAWVLGDAGRLRQILLNLLGNAMKFTERGEVSVDVLRGDSPRAVCFDVRDTGIGIPLEKQAMIFEAFAQADGSARRQQGGTGLGLAICSKLVHLMNGRIEVESSPGKGSRFRVTIELEEAAPGTEIEEDDGEVIEDAAVGRQPGAKPLRILLAEDNAVNRKLVQRVVEKLGHSIVLAGNGREAVEAVQREGFDMILMDVQMPEMDGLSAARAIREWEGAHAPVRRVPIVALTAHAMSGDREQCLLAGMDSYIVKPIQIQTLIDTIEAVSGQAQPA